MNIQDLQKLPFELSSIFRITSDDEFFQLAKLAYAFQLKENNVYRSYINLLGRENLKINKLEDIPFLPISLFKSQEVKVFDSTAPLIFESSGTTGTLRSKHFVLDPSIYQLSFIKGFEHFFGNVTEYLILGLLPSYLENGDSSLVYMVDQLIQLSGNSRSGFFLNDYKNLLHIIESEKTKKKILLIGVSYALLDLVEQFHPDLSGCIIVETGGMKGRRKELTKKELQQRLREGLNVEEIYSEYGMTELLSQAYSIKDQKFSCPPWMKMLVRKQNDPFDVSLNGNGGLNVIDLANILSCPFVATEDLVSIQENQFEILGRLDNSDLRGCNLLIY